MQDSFIPSREEKKNAKIFLWVLHIALIVYETVYSITLKQSMLFMNPYVMVLKIVCGVGLIGFSVYYFKKGQAHIIKYLYVLAYMCAESFNLCWYAIHNKVAFDDGNIIEFVLILFVPIFLSKRYLFCIYLLIIGKYIVFTMILGEMKSFMPLVIYSLLFFVSYLILNRFLQYLSAIKRSVTEVGSAQKLAVVGKMAASVGHEIKNPLASLKGFTQLQKEKHAEDPVYENMIHEIEYMNNMISKLMAIATCKPSIYNSHVIAEVVSSAVKEIHPKMEEKQIQLIYDPEDSQVEIECDYRKLKGVFLYVIRNAVEAMSRGGKLEIRIENKSRDYVVVSMIDNGYGIEKEDLELVTEAFYTTKQDGIGLGLTVAKRIIEEHLGGLHISSEQTEGTKVEIILPRKRESYVTLDKVKF
ncbi:ATP-binding protein [Bacillus gaemokensis]|uniref:histidine kinase n=1 Tax=Bacillus gaemokensis TaxID=574375 RepID=A0A073KQC3_9BACI|nr:ATP-binding protein [Bacillus gaemokensis]KEK24588.1 histidine kinase [Bacillus gaemokensis]KYG39476.1 histidine kinase [Bacillus gaemokensis]